MSANAQLSRRERQIVDILYARGGATARDVRDALDDPPTEQAVRRLLQILEEKGHVRRKKVGRENLYVPKLSKKRAGVLALQHTLDTFFSSVLEDALAAHFARRETELSDEEADRLVSLIQQARSEGR
jgi:predicted transcriptional regulator